MANFLVYDAGLHIGIGALSASRKEAPQNLRPKTRRWKDLPRPLMCRSGAIAMFPGRRPGSCVLARVRADETLGNGSGRRPAAPPIRSGPLVGLVGGPRLVEAANRSMSYNVP